jgi:hypothetical protein
LVTPAAVTFTMVIPGKIGALDGSTCTSSRAQTASSSGSSAGSNAMIVTLHDPAAARSTSLTRPSGSLISSQLGRAASQNSVTTMPDPTANSA